MLRIVKGIRNLKTSLRHVNFLKQLKKTEENTRGSWKKNCDGFSSYRYANSIFTLGQTSISILWDSHIVMYKRSWWYPPELPHRAVDTVYFHFFFNFLTKMQKWHMCKKIIRRGHSMPVPFKTNNSFNSTIMPSFLPVIVGRKNKKYKEK